MSRDGKDRKARLAKQLGSSLGVEELLLSWPSCVARQTSSPCKMGQQEYPSQASHVDVVAQARPPGQSLSFIIYSAVYRVAMMCQAAVHRAAYKDPHAICPGHTHF